MFRTFIKKYPNRNIFLTVIQRRTFLSNSYKCTDAWSEQTASPILNKIKLNDFYNMLDQNYVNKGVISAIDVDIFANAIKDTAYLEELRDLVHKLRLSAETGNMLDSTQHAIVRNFIQFERIEELIDILKDPLNYGVFLDNYVANILLDKLITSSKYEQAANIASVIMLQEEFENEITCTLCQYATLKYIEGYCKPQLTVLEEKNNKVEEIKIRVKFVRNPYFDDHFDIRNLYTLSGKTLAWVSERYKNNLNMNLQIIGWLVYKKYNTLIELCDSFIKMPTSKVYPEVIELMKRECNDIEEEHKAWLNECISKLSKVEPAGVSLKNSLQIAIENAINKTQHKDISDQQELFKRWAEIREQKLEEQTKRLDRAKRMEIIEEKQKELKTEEQKLWFFEKEDSIDLEIEEKEKLKDTTPVKENVSKTSDENYIPPEILPKRN